MVYKATCKCNICRKNILEMPNPTWIYVDNKPVCIKCHVRVKKSAKRLKVVA